MIHDDNIDDPEDDPNKSPYWYCEYCGHIDRVKSMPEDRSKFYRQIHEKGSPQCPKCKSESFMPVGY